MKTKTFQQKPCIHNFKVIQKEKHSPQSCVKCGQSKLVTATKQLQKNDPAFKQSINILPLVAAFVDKYKLFTNWLDIDFQGWRLPAISEPHEWCGLWTQQGCLNAQKHKRLGKGSKIYLKQFQRSCYRATCKICYLKWIAREANSATRRIEKYTLMTMKKPIHLMLIVPPSQHNLPIKILRKRMNHILKIAQLDGAAVTFHPFRFRESTKEWHPYPHFHLVGFGNEQEIRKSFGRYRWYVKNEGERESVFQTFCYILSHAGIKKGNHAVTWFGKISYRKMSTEKEPKISQCPICEEGFEEIYYIEDIHPVVPPNKPYEGLVDAKGWYPVKTEKIHPKPQNVETVKIRGTDFCPN